MNAELINPYIQGAQRVLAQICGERPNLGKVFLKKPPYQAQNIAISVSTIGAIEGTAVYTMDNATGLYLAAKMMAGMPVTTLDEIAKSALCELTNMISGNVSTVFAEKGVLTDITTPSFFGESYPLIGGSAVCIPLALGSGLVFEVDVCTL